MNFKRAKVGQFPTSVDNTAYEKVGAPGLQRAACLAHARHYFVKAQEVAPEGDCTAMESMEVIARIYAVEA